MQKNEFYEFSKFIQSRLLKPLNNRRISLIYGIPHCGKTTLLNNIAKKTTVPTHHLTLDPRDCDLNHLVKHLATTLATQFPQLQTLLNDNAKALLVGNWSMYIKDACLIILDDFDCVNHCKKILTFINQLIKSTPFNCQFIIASRATPNLNHATLITAHPIKTQDMAFQVDEIQALFSVCFGEEITKQKATLLHKKTQGWVMGLLSLANGISSGNLDTYFKTFFKAQTKTIQKFLLKTVSFEIIDTPNCHHSFGDGNWERLINKLAKRNLFVSSVYGENGVQLTYQPQFKHFLQVHRKKLLKKATKWVKKKKWGKAYKLYSFLDDMEGVADLIEVCGRKLWMDGKQDQLLTWIDKLPKQLFNSRGNIISLKGILETFLGNPDFGLTLQNQAIALLKEKNQIEDWGRGLVWRATAHHFLDNHEAMLQDANDALTLTKDKENLKSVFAGACRVKGLALYHSKQASQSISYLEKALNIYQALNFDHDAAIVAQDMGLVYADLGYSDPQVKHYYHKAASYWSEKKNTYRLAAVENDLGAFYLSRGNYLEALNHLEAGVLLAQKSKHVRAETAAKVGLADLYTLLNEYDVANLAYQAAYSMALNTADHFLMIYIKVAQVMLACQQHTIKQLNYATNELKQLQPKTQYQAGLCKMAFGYEAFITNNKQASTYLKEAVNLLKSTGQTVHIAQAEFLLACATIAQGKAYTCNHPLINPAIIHLARIHKNLVEKMDWADALLAINTFNNQLPFLRQQIKREETIFKQGRQHIKLCIFGKSTQVFINNIPITWLSLYAKHLLFILITHPNGLTVEKIGLLFWPDETETYIKNRINELLREIRQSLGKDTVVLQNKHYQFNRFIDYSCDFEQYWQLIAEAENTPPNSKPQIELYKQAICIYNKPDVKISVHWTLTEAKALELSITETLFKVASFYFKAKDYQQALKFCSKLVSINPFAERAYYLGLKTYIKLGENAEAIRLFKLCENLLQTELGVLPSPKTINLFETLMKGAKNESFI